MDDEVETTKDADDSSNTESESMTERQFEMLGLHCPKPEEPDTMNPIHREMPPGPSKSDSTTVIQSETFSVGRSPFEAKGALRVESAPPSPNESESMTNMPSETISSQSNDGDSNGEMITETTVSRNSNVEISMTEMQLKMSLSQGPDEAQSINKIQSKSSAIQNPPAEENVDKLRTMTANPESPKSTTIHLDLPISPYYKKRSDEKQLKTSCQQNPVMTDSNSDMSVLQSNDGDLIDVMHNEMISQQSFNEIESTDRVQLNLPILPTIYEETSAGIRQSDRIADEVGLSAPPSPKDEELDLVLSDVDSYEIDSQPDIQLHFKATENQKGIKFLIIYRTNMVNSRFILI